MASKHHFVPQFYLDAFVDPSSRGYTTPYLWVVDLHNKTVKRRSVKNVARIAGFYDWKELVDKAPSIESIYSQIESRVAQVIRKLRDGNFKLTDKERYHLSIFLGLQLSRTPRFRKASDDTLIKHVQDSLDNFVNDDKRLQASLDSFNTKKVTPETALTIDSIRDFVKKKRFKVTANPDYTLQTTLQAGLQFSKLIFVMHWLFVIATEETRFYTSDVPVALLTPDAKPRKIDFEGSRNPELELSFPISPSCILFLREQEFPETVAFTGDDVINEINQRIFPVVDKHVFCSSEQQGRWVLEQEISTETE